MNILKPQSVYVVKNQNQLSLTSREYLHRQLPMTYYDSCIHKHINMLLKLTLISITNINNKTIIAIDVKMLLD